MRRFRRFVAEGRGRRDPFHLVARFRRKMRDLPLRRTPTSYSFHLRHRWMRGSTGGAIRVKGENKTRARNIAKSEIERVISFNVYIYIYTRIFIMRVKRIDLGWKFDMVGNVIKDDFQAGVYHFGGFFIFFFPHVPGGDTFFRHEKCNQFQTPASTTILITVPIIPHRFRRCPRGTARSTGRSRRSMRRTNAWRNWRKRSRDWRTRIRN